MAGAGRYQSRHESQQRALTDSVGTEYREQVPRIDLKTDAREQLTPTATDAYITQIQQTHDCLPA